MVRHTLKIFEHFYSASDHFGTLYIKGLQQTEFLSTTLGNMRKPEGIKGRGGIERH